MTERAAGVVRRVDKLTLDLAGELLFERFEGEEIVAEDEAVIEEVVVRDAMPGVIRFLRVFEEDARLQPGPVFLPNPSEFEFLFLRHGLFKRVAAMDATAGFLRSLPSICQ